MTDIAIHAQTRDVLGKKTRTLRTAGDLPAVLYGNGIENRILSVNRNDFQRAYRLAGESTLVDLSIGSDPSVKVIIQDIQRHPVTGMVQHVDFHQVKMTEKITAEIQLAFVGESAAVKEQGGVLVKNLDEVEVKALPGDLVHEITVDITSLKTFDDIIRVKDLALPKGIEILSDLDDVVCLVTPPRTDKELADLEQKVEEKVDTVEGVKKEEPETAEGEASADKAAKPASTKSDSKSE
jgi:large subunit ribosomal protein L25